MLRILRLVRLAKLLKLDTYVEAIEDFFEARRARIEGHATLSPLLVCA